MWKRVLVTGTLGFLLSSAPAFAQQVPDKQPPATASARQGLAAQMLAGLPVYSSDNQKVGQVKSIDVDANGAIKSIEAEIEGFLGLGTSSVRFASDQFQHKEDRIVLSNTAGQVRGVPDESYKSFDRNGSGSSSAP